MKLIGTGQTMGAVQALCKQTGKSGLPVFYLSGARGVHSAGNAGRAARLQSNREEAAYLQARNRVTAKQPRATIDLLESTASVLGRTFAAYCW